MTAQRILVALALGTLASVHAFTSSHIPPRDVEIRASDCSIGTRTQDEVRTRGRCTWNASTPFDLTWTPDELRLTVGSTTIRRTGRWRVESALRVSAVGSARVTVATAGDRKVGKTISGRPMSSEPVDLVITKGRDKNGWTISGTVERLGGGGPEDAVMMSLDPPQDASWNQSPWATSAGMAGPYNPTTGSPIRGVKGAGTRTWTGDTSANWSEPSNWSPSGVPLTGEVLTFASGGRSTTTLNTMSPSPLLGGVIVTNGNYQVQVGGLTLGGGSQSSIEKDFRVDTLSGAGTITLVNQSTLSVGRENTPIGPSTFSGTITGSNGTLAKDGSGAFTFTGNGTGLRATNVREGSFLLSGGSLSDTTVTGSTFAMPGGTVGALNVRNGGQFGDGSVGVGNSRNLQLEGSTYIQPISGPTSFQQLKVAGTVRVSYNGATTLNVQLTGSAPVVGTTIIIVDNDGTDAVSGTFKDLPEGATITTGAVTFKISYVAGTGNDIGLTVTSGPAPPIPPDLSIAKHHAGDFTAGLSGTYTITVRNDGTGPTSGTVTVADTLPSGFVPSSASGAPWGCSISGQTVTCSRTDALAAGQSYNDITLTVQVASTASSAPNTATVSGGGDVTLGNNTATDETTVIAPANVDLAITKRAQEPFTQGGRATYTLDVSNVGTTASSGTVTVSDDVPSPLTSPTASGDGWSCAASGQRITCTRSSSLSGGTAYPTITLSAGIPANAPASVSNTATVAVGGDTGASNNTATIVTTIGAAGTPDLGITKTHADPFAQGQTGATFTLTVTNGGKGPTNGTVTVTDTLPTGFTATSAGGSGWSCPAAQPMACSRSDSLAAGASYPPVTLTVNVAANAADAANTAVVSGGGDTSSGNNTASDPITVTPIAPGQPPDLTIRKAHSGVVLQGGTATFEIVVSVVGTTATTSEEIIVTDTFPAGLTPATVTAPGWNCSNASSTVTCRRSGVSAGGSSLPTITVAANVSAAAVSTENKATVSGGGDTTPGNNTASDTVTIGATDPDLTITKTHTDPFTPGQQNAPFTIAVRNVGTAPTSGTVTVADLVPAGLTPGAAAGSGWNCTTSSQLVTCTRSDGLAAGSSYPSITLPVNVASDAKSGTNVAAVAGGGSVGPASKSSSDSYTVLDSPNLTISKTHGGQFTQGQSGTVSITVANTSTTPTSGEVQVQDPLPDGLIPTSANGGGWSCTIQGQSVSCKRSDSLGAGQSWPAVAITVNVVAQGGTLNNVATVSGGGDATPGDNSAADQISIVGIPQLTIRKSHAGSVAQGEQALQFTIDVFNNGAAPTTGAVTVTDTLPAGLAPVDVSGLGWNCTTAAPTVTCSRSDTLAVGASYPSIFLTVSVAADAVSTVNQARVEGGGDTTPADNVASDNVPISPPNQPNLTIAKTHSGNFFQGQQGAIYMLRVANAGLVPSTGAVTVTDLVPAGLVPVGATGNGWNCGVGGQTVTCTRSDALASGAFWPDITLRVNVSETAVSTVNTASVSGSGDATSADDAAQDPTTVEPRTSDLAIAKRHADPFTGGQMGAAYHVTVSNIGSAPSSGTVIVSDTVPPGLTPTSASGAGWACAIQSQVATCQRSDGLAPGAAYPEIALLVNVLPNATSATNSATVSGGADANAGNNTASDFTNVNVSADPTITLTLASPLLLGTNADYVAQITNLGPGRVGGTTDVVADLPQGLVPMAGIGAGWTCAVQGAQIGCRRTTTLDANSAFPPITFRAQVRVASGDVTVAATLLPSQDLSLANNRAEVTASAGAPVSALRIAQTVSTNQVAIGSPVTYQVEVTNIGDTRIRQVVVRDLPPRGFVRATANALQSSNRSARQLDIATDGGTLVWSLDTLQPHEQAILTYTLTVGADARTGRQDNQATVDGLDPIGRTVTAGPAIASVDVVTDSFSMLQSLVGRVYEDVDGDGQFTGADRPIPHARIITSTGQAVITDSAGLYNLPSLGTGSVAVSLDKDTVPAELTTADEGPGGRSWTRLLRTPIGGGSLLHQNYALKRAEGATGDLPPLVAAETGNTPESDVMPEAAAGSIPPRREYETRLGSNLLIALGEVSFGAAAPEFGLFEKQNDDNTWGYGSVFFQGGLVSSRNRLTLAYDSHRRLNGTTGRDRLFELDPNDRAYPVFGDASERQEFATSNAKVFARLERGNSHVQYGDLIGDLPSSDRDGGRWSSYQRHLTGGEVRLANAAGNHVTFRAAQPTTAYARDMFSGTALGFINLTNTDIIAGTETLAVETRDRRTPERLLSREVLARGVDYQLEPSSGSVFLLRHISELDSALNLVQIVATYEHETAGTDNMLYSGRAHGKMRGLQLGGTFFSEEGLDTDRFNVAGLDIEQALPKGGRVRADLPYSRGTPNVGATFDSTPVADRTRADGVAAKIDLEQPFSFWNGTLKGSFLRADKDFRNPFSSTITPGSQYANGGIEFAPGKGFKFRAGATDERYETARVDAARTTVSGAVSQTLADHVTLTAGYDSRRLQQFSATTESGLATGGIAVSVGERFEGHAAREQNIQDQDDPTYPDQTMLGARVKLNSTTNLFYTQRISDKAIAPVGDFTGTGFSSLQTTGEVNIGVESRVRDTAQVTSRYQVQNGINGPDAFAVIGVSTPIEIGRGFTGTAGVEHGTSISGQGSDFTSGTLGLAWLKADRFKATTRYEGNSRNGYTGLWTGGLAARIAGALTGLLRAQWLDSDEAQVSGRSIGVLAAMAIRPVTNDRAGVLFSYQYLDRNGLLQTFGTTTAASAWHHRLSTDAYIQPLRRLELYAKVGWEETPSPGSVTVDTYLGQGRAQVSLFRFVDAAIEERYIRQPSTDSIRESTGAEIGFWPIADLRLAVGYHFQDTRDPYGRDLQGSDKGVYVTLSTKLSRLFNLLGTAPPR